MNKKIVSLLLASSVFVSFQTASLSSNAFAEDYKVAVNLDSLIDVMSSHWSYSAVKRVVEELDIMAPKTEKKFMGNDFATRYDVANALHSAAKKLESLSGKNLKVTDSQKQMNDVSEANKEVVNSIVNEYGIMQAMPGNKFMGDEKISRYELTFELNNYLAVLEKNVGRNTLSPINKTASLTDVKDEHWATPSIKNMVDKYQLMAGYPDSTFKGSKSLTRYELAAVLKNFIDYIDKYLIPIPKTMPTPVPTVVPTPEPTPIPVVVEPIPEPTPTPDTREPLKTFDLRLGGAAKWSLLDTKGTKGMLYGPSGQLDIWFPKAGPMRLGIGLLGDYMLYEKAFDKPLNIPGYNRLTAGGTLNWRILGADYADETSLILGAGYDYLQMAGTGYNYSNHGPLGRLALEIPIGGIFSIFADDQFQYFLNQKNNFINNVAWKNDVFAGITIPAYTGFSIQLGYKDTRYKLVDKADMYGDMGGLANLRFRF